MFGNFSKDFRVNNLKKTGLYEYRYGFSVGCYVTDADDILEIHKYLMKKHNMN